MLYVSWVQADRQDAVSYLTDLKNQAGDRVRHELHIGGMRSFAVWQMLRLRVMTLGLIQRIWAAELMKKAAVPRSRAVEKMLVDVVLPIYMNAQLLAAYQVVRQEVQVRVSRHTSAGRPGLMSHCPFTGEKRMDGRP
jgi:hypothetical protein